MLMQPMQKAVRLINGRGLAPHCHPAAEPPDNKWGGAAYSPANRHTTPFAGCAALTPAVGQQEWA